MKLLAAKGSTCSLHTSGNIYICAYIYICTLVSVHKYVCVYKYMYAYKLVNTYIYCIEIYTLSYILILTAALFIMWPTEGTWGRGHSSSFQSHVSSFMTFRRSWILFFNLEGGFHTARGVVAYSWNLMLVLSSPRFDRVLKARPHIPRGRALAYTVLISSLQIDVAIAHDMYTLCICRKFIYTAWCFTWFCWVVSVSIGCLQYLPGSTTNWPYG